MYIKKFELMNFGLYRGAHIISFPHNIPPKNITLIGGLNGRGKTTLLDAITLVLYGRRALKFLHDDRIKYSQYLFNHINKSSLQEETSISLTLGEVTSDHQEIVIRRSWNYSGKGEIFDDFHAYRGDIEDKYLSDNWDYYVEEILPLSISRFFFFDNEKIAQIADDESFESVKDSIKTLLGLTTIDQLKQDMRKMIKRLSTVNDTSEDHSIMKKLTDVQEEITECDRNTKSSVVEAGRCRTMIVQLKKKLAETETEYWNLGGNLGLHRKEIETKKEQLEKVLEVKKNRITEYVNNASIPILLCKPLLYRTFDNLKQDEDVRMSKYSEKIIEMIATLLESSRYDIHIQDEMKKFLIEAKNQLIPDIKKRSLFAVSSTTELLFQDLVTRSSRTISELQNIIVEISDYEQENLQLEMHLSFELNENDIRQIWNKMQKFTSDIIEYESRLSIEIENQNQLQQRMEMLESRRARLLKAGRMNQQSQDYDMRVLRYSSMTIEVMDEFAKRLQIKRVKELEKRIFECFRFVIQKDSVICGIDINSSTLNIKLIDYLGGELLKSQLSAGEKQLFAVSILWGLAQCSGYQMPVIVDTPLGRLDSNHRKNFLEKYLPFASKQVIVLSTDEEINGRYLDIIKPYTNAVYTLVYEDIDKSTSIQRGYFGGEVV